MPAGLAARVCPPGLHTRPLDQRLAELQVRDPRGHAKAWGRLPRIPVQPGERDSPAFACIWPRRGGALRMGAWALEVFLRGCLASGSDASNSYENLAGTLFDSSDSVLESPRGARPWGV